MMPSSALLSACLVLSCALLCSAAVDGEIDPSELDLDSATTTTTTFELDDDSSASADVSELGRAAGFGHSSIAAGKQPPIDILGGGAKFVPPPPPFLTKPSKPLSGVPIGVAAAAAGDVPPFAVSALDSCIIVPYSDNSVIFFHIGSKSSDRSSDRSGVLGVHSVPLGEVPQLQGER